MVLFIVSYLIEGRIDRALTLILIATAFLSGALAFLFHLLIVVFGFIVHLPVLSSIYAVILASLARIHLMFSGFILRKVLTRSKRYKKFHARVINSKFYQFDLALFHKVLKGLGIEKPKKVHVIEMTHCPNCGKEIPLHGRYCTECGALVEEKED
jgi:hypothetical protein